MVFRNGEKREIRSENKKWIDSHTEATETEQKNTEANPRAQYFTKKIFYTNSQQSINEKGDAHSFAKYRESGEIIERERKIVFEREKRTYVQYGQYIAKKSRTYSSFAK